MTTAQTIAMCLAYALAFLRLSRAIQPSYKYLPAWAQIGLTVAIAGVGVLADSLGNDVSKLDLADSVLMALGAGLAAWKGRAASPAQTSRLLPPATLLLLAVLGGCSALSRVTPEQRAAAYAHEAKAIGVLCKAYRFDRAAGLVPEVPEAEKACP